MVTLTLLIALGQTPPPTIETSSVPAFARAVGERLASLTVGPMGFSISTQRRAYTLGIIWGTEPDELFSLDASAMGLWRSARTQYNVGMGASGVALVALAFYPVMLLTTGITLATLIVAPIIGLVAVTVGALFMTASQQALFEAVRVYNHALLQPGLTTTPLEPPPMPPAVLAPVTTMRMTLVQF